MEEDKYAIHVEWLDEISSLLRTFTLFYYPSDKSVEMASCLYLISTKQYFHCSIFFSMI